MIQLHLLVLFLLFEQLAFLSLGELLVCLSLFWREPLLDQFHAIKWEKLMHGLSVNLMT